MPTGLTADIYEGKSMSLRRFALDCARQLGGGYQASDYGNKILPMDKPPVLEPSTHHREQLEKAEEDLDFWLHVQKDPIAMKLIYDREQTKHEKENAEHDARMKGIKERYKTMIDRVEQWQVPEQYALLKKLMLNQLLDSYEWDYRPDLRPYRAPQEPINKWMERNISTARRDIEYHKEKLAEEEKRISEINAYVKGLYDLLDEVEPYKDE